MVFHKHNILHSMKVVSVIVVGGVSTIISKYLCLPTYLRIVLIAITYFSFLLSFFLSSSSHLTLFLNTSLRKDALKKIGISEEHDVHLRLKHKFIYLFYPTLLGLYKFPCLHCLSMYICPIYIFLRRLHEARRTPHRETITTCNIITTQDFTPAKNTRHFKQ